MFTLLTIWVALAWISAVLNIVLIDEPRTPYSKEGAAIALVFAVVLTLSFYFVALR